VIVVDTSALIALVRGEREAERCRVALVDASGIRLSAGSLVEASIVLESRFGPAAVAELDEMLGSFAIEVCPVDLDHVALARQAFRLFGKGRHPAALNFGDCFSYALARLSAAPLLCVGNGFARTDIEAA
jgi:ribonuclease VapC